MSGNNECAAKAASVDANAADTSAAEESLRRTTEPAAEESLLQATEPAAESPDWRFVPLLAALGFFFIEWVTEKGRGIGVTAFTAAFAAVALSWFRARNIRPSKGVCAYLAWILPAALSFALYQNPLTEEPLLLLMIAAVPYFFAAACGIRTENQLGGFLALDAWDALLSVPLGGAVKFLSASGAALKRGRLGKGVFFALLGVILSLPVTMGISFLLREADAAFSSLWLRLDQEFMFILRENTVQLLFSIPATLYLSGVFYGTDARKGSPRRSPEEAAALKDRCRLFPAAFAAGGVTPLLLIYVLFFFSQTAYFLNAFKGLLPAGMAYSEYARRGFFELCAVSGINLIIILALRIFTLRAAEAMLKIYTLALSLFSLAMIVISLRKMLLYIHYYGLTPKRLGTSWFMIFLLIVFLLIILSVFRPALNTVKWSAAVGAIMLLLFCYADISARIADYNVGAYRNGRLAQLDLDVLRELGDGTTPFLLDVMLSESMDRDLREEARQILRERAKRLNWWNNAGEDWRDWTLAGSRSKNLLREHRVLIFAGLPNS